MNLPSDSADKPAKSRNLTIDAARAMAIILVVYGHVIEHSMAPFSQDYFSNPVLKIIYSFHMPLFVFISGYLMAESLKRHSLQDVFISRCKSILVPAVFLTIAGTVIAWILNRAFGFEQVNVAGGLWFLWTLFAVSIVLLLTIKVQELLGIIAVPIIYFLLMIIPGADALGLYHVKWFYLFYLAGHFFNRRGLQVSGSIIVMTALTVIFFLLSAYWTTGDYIYINKMHVMGELSRLFYRYTIAFLGIAIVLSLSVRLAGKIPFLQKIGKYTLDIYIIQLLLLEGIYPRIIGRLHLMMDFNSPMILGVAAPLLTAFFVWGSLLISKHLLRKSQLLSQLFLGGRAS